MQTWNVLKFNHEEAETGLSHSFQSISDPCVDSVLVMAQRVAYNSRVARVGIWRFSHPRALL